MSKVLAVNAGSSSLKFQLLEMPEAEVLTSGIVERIGLNDGIITFKYSDQKDTDTLDIPDHHVAVDLVLKGLVEKNIVSDLSEIVAAGHRVVHGGEYFQGSAVCDEVSVAQVEELADLAPLHNPANLIGYRAFKEALPNATHIFAFDTAFHQTMPEEVFMYALPYEYYSDLAVRRYGAHGISHEYVAQRTAELMGKKVEDVNLITLHLGNGASISAVKGGKCVNTSMGFTPLAGLMMGTRTGDLDPAIVTYLMRKLDITAVEVLDIFNKKSGMAGISGISSDARDIENGIDEGNERAILTRKMYAQRVLEYVGAYTLQLGHVDGLVFTAGLGENDTGTREAILDVLQPGLKLDFDRELNNKTRGKEVKLSTDASSMDIWVCPTNEELVIATDAYRIHNEQN
ncbi:acetate kinase [Erysipelothrix rhusiopathiae]|uniref:acetate/propionate family kinase n=1 Tax=Erysipelothrix rhusiopathiae TaxID=1648 RepID=UPI000E083E00|nr:acetate kinase [Erysipelothrix rhusiopathiae]MDE8257190.1 acetate kinase [Erysipelothrix rhusiopathiae]MDE8341837.1 acetate kinase [Erysipelothrix rhusiopathiae]MDV7679928.1 acetate kinase [Erysipelothrix rhusiopathiae]RNM32121.1 acetate kinase [Erysipelothrix rhusiopathiae]STD03918.1 Acetate kinase [Erysipelothrix rhusiopathiae]